jgi:DNA-binding CsgD family transcriptional regulator
MSQDANLPDPTWILAGEDGSVLAATEGFSVLCSKCPQFQQFLKLWHRAWPGARAGWPNCERVLAGQNDGPALKLKAAPMLLVLSDGLSALSNQLCGVLIKVSEVRAADSLESRFGLTLGEQRVAEMVIEGKTPAEIAVSLRLSVFTIRAYMKRLFVKTGSHSRARLVRVLLDAQQASSAPQSISGGVPD